MTASSANIAQHLPLMAARQPAHPALKIPRGRTSAGDIDYLTLSFAELDTEVSAWAARITASGVGTDDRVLVMVRQGLPLIAAAFALFKIGAVPVVIDPGMGLKSFLSCVARSQPKALVGIPLARLISRVFRRHFRSVSIRVAASSSSKARLAAPDSQPSTLNPQLVKRTATDLAAVLFTSGSTGAPKGVRYEHGMFAAQVRLIRETYNIQPGEIDLPMLPIFALFNPALGMTTVVPEINPSRPAAVDPAKIVQAIRQENVTNSFGSPTLWNKIADHCLARDITLPSLRRVLCAGAPVPASLWEKSRRFLPHGLLHSPYGATEALPLATISAENLPSIPRQLIDDAQPAPALSAAHSVARGACVGQPVSGIDLKIIAITDAPIATLKDAIELPAGQIGEIIVRGPVVTKSYDALSEATASAKIADAQLSALNSQPFALSSQPGAATDGSIWHRMGDCGYLDTEGRLWFCGRKAERVETATGPLFTEPCEQVFRQHPKVSRCALIGLGPRGQQTPALVVQPRQKLTPSARQSLAVELHRLARQHPHTTAIARFYFHPDFPVDVRHNAKIHRLTLARWAENQRVRDING